MAEVLVQIFWIGSGLGLLFLAGLMLRKKLHREFPVFFALVVAEGLDGWLAMALKAISPRAQYIEYWTMSAVTSVLGFLVLREVFLHIFRPYEALRNFGKMLFRWSAAVLFLIAAVMTLSSAASSNNPLALFTFTLDRSVRLMQCGLVLFLYLFAKQLGLTERHRVFGMSIGFGIAASVHLMFDTLVALSPAANLNHLISILNVPYELAWVATVVIWTVYMYRPEPERRRATVLELPESWNYTLTGINNENNAGAAFLPSVVDTVERVLTRRAMAQKAGLPN
jgi:hypothetical protein